jgi:uncharacterized protein YggE
MQKNNLVSLGLVVIVLLFIFQYMNWGSVIIRPPQTITVNGMAESEEQNQVATFYAGASAVNADKQVAITEVNTKVEEVLTKIKEFGVDPADIQTQNLSVYQEQEQYTEGGVQRFRPGQWRATNSLNIKLRDISKASDLVTLLAESGLTDISGPNFSMDDSSKAETALLTSAVKNAREKADLLAQEQNKKVYKVLSITEGAAQTGLYPMFDRAMSAGGGGAPVQPGSTTVSTTVTVVFEVR